MLRVGLVTPRGSWARIAACAVAFLAVGSPALAQQAPAPGTTLDRIRETGQVRFGYRADARPFSYRDESGGAAGYTVGLCLKVADEIKAELGLADLNVQWVPVTAADRFTAVQGGQIDMLCGAATETLERRQQVAFSIPIFPGGVGAVLRSDAPIRLQEVLSGQKLSDRPVWRANAGQLLQAQKFAVVAGTTAEHWLAAKLTEFQLTAEVVPVDGYAAGIRALLDRQADVFFGDRAILMDAVARDPSLSGLSVLDRLFTYERVALALSRGDDAFRLVVDRALSRFYASGGLRDLYVQWFGEPGDNVLGFFRWTTLPQ
jgi:putrescine:ornithine antiporter